MQQISSQPEADKKFFFILHLFGPHSPSERFGKINNTLPLWRIESRFFGRVAHVLSILTVLFRLHLTKILLVIAGEFVHLICRKL
jgi:hypothetical protein